MGKDGARHTEMGIRAIKFRILLQILEAIFEQLSTTRAVTAHGEAWVVLRLPLRW